MLPKSTVSIAYEELPTGNTNLNLSICLSVSNPTSNMTARVSRCRIYAGIGSSLAIFRRFWAVAARMYVTRTLLAS